MYPHLVQAALITTLPEPIHCLCFNGTQADTSPFLYIFLNYFTLFHFISIFRIYPDLHVKPAISHRMTEAKSDGALRIRERKLVFFEYFSVGSI